MTECEQLVRAQTLIQNSVVCDAIVPWTEYGDPTMREATFDRYAACGYNFLSLSLCSDAESTDDVLKAVGRVRYQASIDPRIALIDDLSTVRGDAYRLHVSMNCQGTNYLGGDLRLVEVFRSLGVTQTLLAYNRKNPVGDGCHERTDAGLSGYGLELVAEMNRTGMIVDCSHCGLHTSLDAIDASDAPVVFSHSNARALHEHERNIIDEQAIACAATEGWIGVNGLGIFMNPANAVCDEVFRHIDYYCELIGPEHVGLGSDFLYDIDDMKRYMKRIASPASGGYDHIGEQFEPESLSTLVKRMLAAGYSDVDVSGILGGNYLRVAADVAATGRATA